jgi:hypothetical protein
MKITLLIDAIALLCFADQSLSASALSSKLSLLTPWQNWDEQKLLEDCYRSTRRLRLLGAIEEVVQPGREKFFRITAIGNDDVNEILKTFKLPKGGNTGF